MFQSDPIDLAEIKLEFPPGPTKIEPIYIYYEIYKKHKIIEKT